MALKAVRTIVRWLTSARGRKVNSRMYMYIRVVVTLISIFDCAMFIHAIKGASLSLSSFVMMDERVVCNYDVILLFYRVRRNGSGLK